jgi:hypothetical protein
MNYAKTQLFRTERPSLSKQILRRLTYCLSALALLVSGCASTKMDLQWSNPELATRKMEGTVLIVGLTQDEAMRRAYEDDVASRLAARGVKVLRSYEVVPGAFDAESSQALFNAAKSKGATSVLASAVIAHEHIARVSVDEPSTRVPGVYSGWYNYYWPYLYRRTEVRIIERYMASTVLTDVATGKIRWTARTHTDATESVASDIKGFVSVVIDGLRKEGFL